MMRILFMLATFAMVASCSVDRGVGGPCQPFDTGESPCKEQFYFPTGLAVDPAGDVLYVSNANADLRYSGGTIMALRLHAFDCAVDFARSGYSTIPEGCSENELTIPQNCLGSGARIAPSTSDSQGCMVNFFDPGIIECDECLFVSDAVRIGNFGGSLRVQERTVGETTFPVAENGCPPGAAPAATDETGRIISCTGFQVSQRRLWLPVRGDPSITWVDVQKDGANVQLLCDDPSNPDPARLPNACTTQRITMRDFHSSQTGDATDEIVPLPPEPFGITLDQGLLTPGGTPYARLLIAHLSGGEVTLINAGAFWPAVTQDSIPAESVVLDIHSGFFAADSYGRRGAFALAPLIPGDPLSYWYVTSRVNPVVAMFRIANVGVIMPTLLSAGSFNVSNGPFLFGDDVRDLAFAPDANRGFFLNDHPPALFTVDTRIDATAAPRPGVPRNYVVDAVSVCQGDSHIAVRQWLEPGAPGEPERQLTRVYVVCYTTGQVMIVDPDLSIVLDTIQVGGGSNDIAFNFGGNIHDEPAHRRAYVTNYIDMTISVIDLDRGSPTENRVISRIGLTSPPQI